MLSHSAITYNIVLCGVILALCMVLRKTEYSIGRKIQIQCFRRMILGYMVSFIFTILDSFNILFPSAQRPFMAHVSILGIYAFSAYGAMEWVNFVATTTKLKWEEQRWWQILMWLPLAATVLLIITPFYKTILVQNSEGEYSYGPGSTIIMILFLIYMAMAFVISIAGTRAASSRRERGIRHKLFLTMLILWTGIIVSAVFPYAPVYEISLVPGVFMIYSELVSSLMFTDALTGLNNRRRLVDYLENALTQASETNQITLYMIDLDYFKSINDILGHQVGDKALQIFAEAFRKTPLSRSSMLGRMGGDEFLAITVGDTSPDQMRSRLEENLNSQLAREKLEFPIYFSMGCTQTIDSRVSVDRLLERADHALYENKAKHHDQIQGYTEKLKACVLS